jgi:hypothetical protein
MSEPMSKGLLPTDAMIEAANDLLAPIYAECGRLITDHPGMDITPHLPPLEARLFDALWEATYPSASPPADIEGLVKLAAQGIFDESHYAYEKPMRGYLAKQHDDDVERALRQARAALEAIDLPTLLADRERMREAIEPFIAAARRGVAVAEAVKDASLKKRGLSPLSFPEIDAGVNAAQSQISFNDWKQLAALQPTGGSGDE